MATVPKLGLTAPDGAAGAGGASLLLSVTRRGGARVSVVLVLALVADVLHPVTSPTRATSVRRTARVCVLNGLPGRLACLV